MAMSPEQQDEQAKAYGRVVAKAWSDEVFEQQLLTDPTAVLKAEGVMIPDGIEVRVVENTDTLVYTTLPARSLELSGTQLDEVAGRGAQYGEMWAQDLAAMSGYHAGAGAG